MLLHIHLSSSEIRTLLNNTIFFIFHRYNSVHLHPIPFDASNHHQHFDRHRNRLLWLRDGPQRVRLAKGENDMRSKSESTEFDHELTNQYNKSADALSKSQWPFAYEPCESCESQSHTVDAHFANQPYDTGDAGHTIVRQPFARQFQSSVVPAQFWDACRNGDTANTKSGRQQ